MLFNDFPIFYIEQIIFDIFENVLIGGLVAQLEKAPAVASVLDSRLLL